MNNKIFIKFSGATLLLLMFLLLIGCVKDSNRVVEIPVRVGGLFITDFHVYKQDNKENIIGVGTKRNSNITDWNVVLGYIFSNRTEFISYFPLHHDYIRRNVPEIFKISSGKLYEYSFTGDKYFLLDYSSMLTFFKFEDNCSSTGGLWGQNEAFSAYACMDENLDLKLNSIDNYMYLNPRYFDNMMSYIWEVSQHTDEYGRVSGYDIDIGAFFSTEFLNDKSPFIVKKEFQKDYEYNVAAPKKTIKWYCLYPHSFTEAYCSDSYSSETTTTMITEDEVYNNISNMWWGVNQYDKIGILLIKGFTDKKKRLVFLGEEYYNEHETPYLLILTENHKLILERYYKDYDNFIPIDITEVDNGYLLLCKKGIIKIDYDGNVIWYKKIFSIIGDQSLPDSEHLYFTSFVKTDDNSIVATANLNYMYPPHTLDYKQGIYSYHVLRDYGIPVTSFVLKFSLEGKLDWYRKLDTKRVLLSQVKICCNKIYAIGPRLGLNKEYINFCNKHADTCGVENSYYISPYLYKLDLETGEKLYEKSFLTSSEITLKFKESKFGYYQVSDK